MSIALAMVTLSQPDTVSRANLTEALAHDWPTLPSPQDVQEKDGIISFILGEMVAYVAHMPAPIPWGDLDEACSTSILWPNATETLKAHQTHLIVTVTGEVSAVSRATLLTQVIGSIIAVNKSVNGVYWCEAGLVVPAPMFREFATEILPKGPPLYIWVNFRVGRNENGLTSGFTRGLSALDLMDIETDSATETPQALRERLLAITGYLLDNGQVIKDGDSVGNDETEKIRVVFGPSQYGASAEIMRLEYGEPKKPFWKVW